MTAPTPADEIELPFEPRELDTAADKLHSEILTGN